MNKIEMYKQAANKVVEKAKKNTHEFIEDKKKRAKSTIHEIHESVYKKSKEFAAQIKPKKKR